MTTVPTVKDSFIVSSARMVMEYVDDIKNIQINNGALCRLQH